MTGGPARTSPTPIRVVAGDCIFHRGTDRYLGVVTELRRHTVRFVGPGHSLDALATRYEIYVGPCP